MLPCRSSVPSHLENKQGGWHRAAHRVIPWHAMLGASTPGRGASCLGVAGKGRLHFLSRPASPSGRAWQAYVSKRFQTPRQYRMTPVSAISVLNC